MRICQNNSSQSPSTAQKKWCNLLESHIYQFSIHTEYLRRSFEKLCSIILQNQLHTIMQEQEKMGVQAFPGGTESIVEMHIKAV